MAWCADAARLGDSSEVHICEYVDKYVRCDSTMLDEHMLHAQTHMHKHNCKKNLRKPCRYNFPQPPMLATCVQHPLLPDECTTPERTRLRAQWANLHATMNNLGIASNLAAHDAFLALLNVTQ